MNPNRRIFTVAISASIEFRDGKGVLGIITSLDTSFIVIDEELDDLNSLAALLADRGKEQMERVFPATKMWFGHQIKMREIPPPILHPTTLSDIGWNFTPGGAHEQTG